MRVGQLRAKPIPRWVNSSDLHAEFRRAFDSMRCSFVGKYSKSRCAETSEENAPFTYMFFLYSCRISIKYIDAARDRFNARSEQEKNDSSRDKSILESLLGIDESTAYIMALDMLTAGIDTVRKKSEFFYSKSRRMSIFRENTLVRVKLTGSRKLRLSTGSKDNKN